MVVVKPKIHCNAFPFPNNKGEKTYLNIDKKRIAIQYEDMGIIVLKPHIDRMTFGFSPTQKLLNEYSAGDKLEEYEEYISKDLFSKAKAGSDGLILIEGVPFNKQPYASYNINLEWKSGSGSSVLIQVRPKNDTKSFIKFGFNPNNLGKSGLKEFRKLIDEMLELPGGIIPFHEFLIYSDINQMEIAVDILGAPTKDLEIRTVTDGKLGSKKSHVYKSPKGRQETVYPGAVHGKPGSKYVYDKRKEQIDKGVTPIYGDFYHSRYEIRVGKQKFLGMAKINNRLNRVSIRAIDHKPYSKIHYTHKMFVRFALETTFENALNLVPIKFRPKFVKSHVKVMRNIWDGKFLWSLWPETVKGLGFFDDQAP